MGDVKTGLALGEEIPRLVVGGRNQAELRPRQTDAMLLVELRQRLSARLPVLECELQDQLDEVLSNPQRKPSSSVVAHVLEHSPTYGLRFQSRRFDL